jgi:hypothetical protein
VKRKSLSILGVAVACLCVMAFMFSDDLYDHVSGSQPDPVSIQSRQDTQRPTPSPMRYGKFELPVHLSMDLVQAEHPGRPVTIMTEVLSDIAIRSGALTLKIPPIDGDPERTDPLWSTVNSGFVAETAEYTLGLLPLGRFQVIALFEFTLDREGAKKRVVSQSLYLDVRPDTILSSNVSFRHIDRLALRQDLDDRVLKSLNCESKTANRRRMPHELTLLDATDPTLMPRKIAELRTTEPDVARRMMALNRTHSEPINEMGTGNTDQALVPDPEEEFVRPTLVSHRGQPAFEQAVPVPERLKR